MKRLIPIFLFLSFCAYAQEPAVSENVVELQDSVKLSPPDAGAGVATPPLPELTDEYLDTVNVRKKFKINDYMTIGAQYGVTMSQQWFNPSYAQDMIFSPVYASVLFSRYGKMFGYLPYFGFEAGLEYMHSGFRMKTVDDVQTYYYIGSVENVMSVSEELITVLRLPFRAKFHVDVGPLRFMANLGIYGGYRTDIIRKGIRVESIKNTFLDTDKRFDYGMEGGLGFGLVFDPVEIYVNGLVGWSWMSLFEPTTTPSKFNNYYYRYAYPIDIAISFGVHIQLTKRTGKTTSDIKREAKRIVYGDIPAEIQTDESQDRK